MSASKALREAAAAYAVARLLVEQRRADLVEEVRAAVAAGMSEVHAADLAGVSRGTVRAWLGKGWPGQTTKTTVGRSTLHG